MTLYVSRKVNNVEKRNAQIHVNERRLIATGYLNNSVDLII